ncbi:hypothetical protein SH501x_001179 [Pirellulaceae bacterium SH501]
MKSIAEEAAFSTSVVSRIAGEDLQPGDFVTALHELIELPSFFWCCDSAVAPKDELVRLRCLPHEAGEPFKVIAVCLPFVYSKRANGKLMTFDTRRFQLVKLDKDSGKKVWNRMKSNS